MTMRAEVKAVQARFLLLLPRLPFRSLFARVCLSLSFATCSAFSPPAAMMADAPAPMVLYPYKVLFSMVSGLACFHRVYACISLTLAPAPCAHRIEQ